MPSIYNVLSPFKTNKKDVTSTDLGHTSKPGCGIWTVRVRFKLQSHPDKTETGAYYHGTLVVFLSRPGSFTYGVRKDQILKSN